MKSIIALILVVCSFSLPAFDQINYCPLPGQTAHSAIPICGTSVFTQGAPQGCGGANLPDMAVVCPVIMRDENSFWYKFTCYQGGTLGFLIQPHDPTDDYDWCIYEITGRNPDDVYTTTGLLVAANWTALRGATGASAAGTDLFVCYGLTDPLQSIMPTLIQGHEYLLLVCDFSQSPYGYDLEFSGGTANITGGPMPGTVHASYDAASNTVGVKLNKNLLCSSIAADGSDFTIMPGNIPVIYAEGVNCNQQVDVDSVILQTAQPLPPGNYTVVINTGSDANTIIDACLREIPVGEAVPFAIPAPCVLPVVSAGNDVTVANGNTYSLSGTAYGAGTLLWEQLDGPAASFIQDPAVAATTVSRLQEGVYTFRYTISDAVCSRSDTMTVTVKGLPGISCQIVLPNAFSPNNDGRNDLFGPGKFCAAGHYQFSVFNRWGERVFASNSPSIAWNGHYRGHAQPVGIYVWMVQYTDITGKVYHYKGTVMLVR